MNKDILLSQSKILKQVTDNLCSKLPEGGIYNVSKNLQYCIGKLPVIIQEYNEAEDRITRIRKSIQIQTIIDECKEYLDFILITRQFNAKYVLIELNNLFTQFQKQKIYDLGIEEININLLNLN
jgi:hypothetical protein